SFFICSSIICALFASNNKPELKHRILQQSVKSDPDRQQMLRARAGFMSPKSTMFFRFQPKASKSAFAVSFADESLQLTKTVWFPEGKAGFTISAPFIILSVFTTLASGNVC